MCDSGDGCKEYMEKEEIRRRMRLWLQRLQRNMPVEEDGLKSLRIIQAGAKQMFHVFCAGLYLCQMCVCKPIFCTSF